MPEMDFDWKGIINLLAKHLYSEKIIFVRELIQNAHDAIIRRRHMEAGFGGKIAISIDQSQYLITFHDDGIGMNRVDLEKFLSTIGKGQTRELKSEIDGLIGHFGIGFLSAFVVANKVEVYTKKIGEDNGWLWENTGSRFYEIKQCNLQKTGTQVRVYVDPSEVGLIHQRNIIKIVKDYADMLLVPIHVGDSSIASNTGRMPWEVKEHGTNEAELGCRAYLQSTMRDSVLEVIPFNLEGKVRAKGVLYISSARVFALEAPRTVKISINRMFVCQNAPDILPQWASFVNGVINSEDLSPTAARDNIIRDENFHSFNEELGGIIIQHLKRIREKDSGRFSKILEYHAIRIRAACLAYDDFLTNFSDLIEWRVNSVDRDNYNLTIKPSSLNIVEIIEYLAQKKQSVPYRLLCFESGNTDHFFRMANSANTIVIDASELYEMDLLEEIARKRSMEIKLVRIDLEDAEELFQQIVEKDDLVVNLACEMAGRIDLKHTKLDVSAKLFEPISLPAILRNNEDTVEKERARRIFHDPNQSQDVREMAEVIIKQPPKSMQLIINSQNTFIRRLANVSDMSNRNVHQLMLGVYNSAFLASGTMTEHNAKVLHLDYINLMERSLGFLESEVELSTQLKHIAEERRRLTGIEGVKPQHRIFFMMTPFAEEYKPLQSALREVIENRWECQLFLASDQKYEDRCLDSVRTHMHYADAFVAELTDANPNVMFELGAAFAVRRDRPIINLINRTCSKKNNEERELLPADLASMIYIDYSKNYSAENLDSNGTTSIKDLADFLDEEMKKDVKIRHLLADNRERFISFSRLKKICKPGLVSDASYRKIAAEFQTAEQWAGATENKLIEQVVESEEHDAIGLLLKRIQNHLR